MYLVFRIYNGGSIDWFLDLFYALKKVKYKVAKYLPKYVYKALFLCLSYNSGPIAQLVRVADS